MTLSENYEKALLAMTNDDNYDLNAHLHYANRLIDLYISNYYAEHTSDNAYLQAILFSLSACWRYSWRRRLSLLLLFKGKEYTYWPRAGGAAEASALGEDSRAAELVKTNLRPIWTITS